MQLPLSVLMTSTSYPLGEADWRGVFIRQMLRALSDCPQIQMNFWGPPGELPASVNYACLPQEAAWLKWLMEYGGIAHLLRKGNLRRITASMKLLSLLRRVYKRHRSVALCHVNWLQNALPLWGTKHPILITVLGSDFGLLKLPGMVPFLRRTIRGRSCILAPNAEWMQSVLEVKFGDLARIVPVPFGIDEEWYDVSGKWEDYHPRKWLVISRLTKNKIGPLFNWGEKVFKPGGLHELHLFGPMQEEMTIPEWVHYHGPTYAKDLRENWFPKAAGLVTVSRHDEGRPQVMLEAMAAGLPIIASDLPAHNNFIDHQQTGWLVDNPKKFIAGIEWLNEPHNNHMIASKARDWVMREIGTWRDCAERYLELYFELIKGAG